MEQSHSYQPGWLVLGGGRQSLLLPLLGTTLWEGTHLGSEIPAAGAERQRQVTSSRVAWSDPWGQPESLGKQVCPRCFLDRRAAVQGMSRGRGMGTLEQPETRSRERQAEQERGCPPVSSHLLGPLRAALSWVGSASPTQQMGI